MLFWIGLTILTLGTIVFYKVIPQTYNKSVPILLFIVLTFLGMFRYQIGTDYDWYSLLFYTAKVGDIYPELSFILLVDFLRINGFSFQVMFIIYEILIMAFLWLGLRYYERNNYEIILLALIFFFLSQYIGTLNGIRQELAMLIIFWGYKYCLKRRFLYYALVVLIAFFIHNSAIIALLLYFIPRKLYEWYWYVIAFFISLVIWKLNIMADIIIKLGSILLGDIWYMVYLTDKDAAGNMTGLYLIYQLGVILIARLAIKDINPKYAQMLNCCFFGLLGHFIFAFSLPIVRTTAYFEFFTIIIWALCVMYLNNKIILKTAKYKYLLPLGYLLFVLPTFIFLRGLDNTPQNYYVHWRNTNPSSMNINYSFNFKIFD